MGQPMGQPLGGGMPFPGGNIPNMGYGMGVGMATGF